MSENGDGFTPNKFEIMVLEMLCGERPVERGAWVSASAEFLQEAGYLTSEWTLTQQGENFMKARKQS